MRKVRVVRLESRAEARRALQEIGVDPAGVDLMLPKLRHHLFRLHQVPLRAAILLKQEMLARGGEAAVSREVAALAAEATDVLLSGTEAQFASLLTKLRTQPFGLAGWADELETALRAVEGEGRPAVFELPRHPLPLGARTYVMGILNLTPDSFSDGGRYPTVEAAVAAAEAMVEEGADLIDLGGESTRPGALPVPVEEELRRVVPVAEQLAERLPVPLSVDTTKVEVAKAALEGGVEVVNDTSGLTAAPELARVAQAHGAGLVLMHRRGEPATMQDNPVYVDLWGEVLEHLATGVRRAEEAGVPRSRLVVDPGIGFGKTVEHNLALLRHLEELQVLGLPVLVGTSRKSLIGRVLDLPVEERLEGTLATLVLAVAKGADFVRVHDVRAAVRAVRMADAVVRGRG
ncbi:MAG: dihydropteroate synthase [Bacillota bacterium]|nr:dihydropteroate synthase [Bacillota bacterium]